MSTIKWRGSRGLRLVDNNLDESLEKANAENIYEGPYDLCLAQRPRRGYIDAATGFLITRVKTQRMKGGQGRLTISLESTASTGDTPPPNGLTVELEWEATDIDLLKHPRYQTGGSKVLSDADVVALRNWEEEPNWTLKKAYKYREDTSRPNAVQKTLSTNAQDFAAKKLRGTDSYKKAHPVVKRTRKISNPISGDPCWKLLSDLPSGLPKPAGFKWMKSADNSVRSGSGKWERHEMWTGFDFIDPDLYP